MEYTLFALRLDLNKSHTLSISKDTDATDQSVQLQRHVGRKKNWESLTSTRETAIAGLSDSLATDIRDLLFGGINGS